ncbi:hypothetical protein N825_28820 [Skermanella stibiiresistens SB22]|uniref:DUF4258 domain-containing protein n=1 Tax=Skermanella stibiiresistens SB22 TaxID=1385369 RepID=W9GV12_9PROT|nr:hypothetical protein N825_28820 [Skermanella stibiiresistens SB22]
MSLTLTDHARVRMNQRAFRGTDLDLILTVGTTTRDGVLLRAQDVQRAIEIRKREIARLQRLAGAYVVVAGEKVVTAYRPSRRRQSRVLDQA